MSEKTLGPDRIKFANLHLPVNHARKCDGSERRWGVSGVLAVHEGNDTDVFRLRTNHKRQANQRSRRKKGKRRGNLHEKERQREIYPRRLFRGQRPRP